MLRSPAIDLFKDQLNHLLESIAADRNLLGRNGKPSADRALPYWFLETFLGYTEVTSADDITEGYSDLAVDAVVISDDEAVVHFYQFKNPSNQNNGIEGGAVDKVISGIELILQNRHSKISSQRLRDKIDEIRQKPRAGYVIHFVSTGGGLPGDGKAKLDALCERWATRGTSPLKYDCTDIADLQVLYYNKTVPTLDATVVLKPPREPYKIQIGSHRSFVFHFAAADIAKLYEEHGEKILQQNIRTFEGDTETNLAIYRTATGRDSQDFYYFNNGVTILSDSCDYDPFQGSLSISRPQIVNGGQTVRVLAKAWADKKLKGDVFTTVRVLTSDNDRTFAGNVAVNLNNQTVVKSSFLRSNHPEIIQLAGTLQTKGYYLERREGELESLTDVEKANIERSIHHSISDYTIRLQPACQSYIAFFHTNVDIAKRNPKQIFISAAAGGYFEAFITSGLTAEKFIFAWELYKRAMALKRLIARLSRSKDHKELIKLYNEKFRRFDKYVANGLDLDELEAAAPQSSMFLIALLGRKYNGNPEDVLLAKLDKISDELPQMLFTFVTKSPAIRSRSWPSFLRSQTSFESAIREMKLRKRNLRD